MIKVNPNGGMNCLKRFAKPSRLGDSAEAKKSLRPCVTFARVQESHWCGPMGATRGGFRAGGGAKT